MSLAFDLDPGRSPAAALRRATDGWRSPLGLLRLATLYGSKTTGSVHGDTKKGPSFEAMVLRHRLAHAASDVGLSISPVDGPTSARTGPAVDFSMATLRLVREGCRSPRPVGRLASAATGLDAAMIGLGDGVLTGYLDEQMRLMLGAAADIYVAFGITDRWIADTTGFTDEFDELLQARIPVRPKSFELFSMSLFADLSRSLRRGGSLDRAWGRLEAAPAGLVMRIDPQPILRVDLGERAFVLE